MLPLALHRLENRVDIMYYKIKLIVERKKRMENNFVVCLITNRRSFLCIDTTWSQPMNDTNQIDNTYI